MEIFKNSRITFDVKETVTFPTYNDLCDTNLSSDHRLSNSSKKRTLKRSCLDQISLAFKYLSCNHGNLYWLTKLEQKNIEYLRDVRFSNH